MCCIQGVDKQLPRRKWAHPAAFGSGSRRKPKTSHEPVTWSYWGKETPFGTWCDFILKQTSLFHFCLPQEALKYRTQYNFDELERSQRNTKVRKWPGEMLCKEEFSKLVSFIWGNSKQGGDATWSLNMLKVKRK